MKIRLRMFKYDVRNPIPGLARPRAVMHLAGVGGRRTCVGSPLWVDRIPMAAARILFMRLAPRRRLNASSTSFRQVRRTLRQDSLTFTIFSNFRTSQRR